jgi:hypothetical protein
MQRVSSVRGGGGLEGKSIECHDQVPYALKNTRPTYLTAATHNPKQQVAHLIQALVLSWLALFPVP